MKQIFKTNIGMLTDDVPLPFINEKEILVQVYNSLISTGTELMSLRKDDFSIKKNIDKNKALFEKAKTKFSNEGVSATWQAIKNKIHPSEDSLQLNPIGYSCSGRVVAKGDAVTNFNVGDRVACAGSGIAAHAEYVSIPVNLAVRIPETLSYESASFTTVGSIAMHGLRRAEIQPGETIVITGLGLIGLLSVQIAKAWGLIVIGVDLEKKRNDLAKELGADVCFLAQSEKIEQKIISYTEDIGADAVIICASTKASEPINQAMRICRKKGRVVVVGDVGLEIRREDMYVKELDLVMSTSYGPGRYDKTYEVDGNDYPIGYVRWTENRNMQEMVRLLASRKISTDRLTAKIFSIEESVSAYNYLLDNTENNIAVLFKYPSEIKEKQFESKILLHSKPLTHAENTNIIKVGIIGAGNFASRVHLPNLTKLNEYYSLVAIANQSPAKAKMVGKKFKASYVTTNYKELLNDDSIDMVIITTRHNLHAQIIIDSLNANKHVFVEKPLAMNRKELHSIIKTYETKKALMAVGFNRRYSPLSQDVKKIIENAPGPCFINYRINAGYIPQSSWIHDPKEGGGRIVGECCHFLDLCNYFIGSEIIKINASAIPTDKRHIHTQDNIAVTIEYKNGSVATISYVSIGSKKLGKEYIEFFVDGISMALDDFISLKYYGIKMKNTLLKKKNKGQFEELQEFAKLVKGKTSKIEAIEDAFITTENTFKILDELNYRLR